MIHHRVVAGDTLFRLALAYGSTVEAIAAANNGVRRIGGRWLNLSDDPNLIQIGEVLHIPQTTWPPPAPTDTPAPDGATQAYNMMGAPVRDPARQPLGAHELDLELPGNLDFADGVTLGDEPPWNDYVIPWGHVDAGVGNDNYRWRINARNPQVFAFVDGRWEQVGPHDPHAEPSGGVYSYGPFRQAWSLADADLQQEDDGSWSWETVGIWGATPSCHWYYPSAYTPRPKVPADAVAIGAAIELRLIPEPGETPPTGSLFGGCVGADHWSVETGPRPDDRQVPRFFQPRRLALTGDWRWSIGHVHRDWFNPDRTVNYAAIAPDFIKENPMPLHPTPEP